MWDLWNGDQSGEEYSAMGLIKALYRFKVTDAGALIGTYCFSNHAIYFITNIIYV